MTNTQRRLLTPLVWMLVLSFALLLGGAGCRHGRGGHWGQLDSPDRVEQLAEHLNDLLDDIDATEEQRRVVRAQVDPLIKRASALKAARGRLAQAYEAEWRSPSMGAEKLNHLVAAESETLVAFFQDATRAVAEIHGALDPEQREKLSEYVDRRKR